jgi:hypothetical protein
MRTGYAPRDDTTGNLFDDLGDRVPRWGGRRMSWTRTDIYGEGLYPWHGISGAIGVGTIRQWIERRQWVNHLLPTAQQTIRAMRRMIRCKRCVGTGKIVQEHSIPIVCSQCGHAERVTLSRCPKCQGFCYVDPK